MSTREVMALNITDRIVVTSRSFSKHKVLREELLTAYANVTFNDAGASWRVRLLRRSSTDMIVR